MIAIIGVLGGAVTGAVSAVWGPVAKDVIEQRRRSAELRDRYSPPLLQAAFDLQSRLYNIVRQGFLQSYTTDDELRRYAEFSTLWLLGQYLGWAEILRREVQFLDFGSTSKNRALQRALGRVATELATDLRGRTFAVFRTTQRAIGELMILEPEGPDMPNRTVCIGYAEFARRLDEPAFGKWFSRLLGDLDVLRRTSNYDRLIRVQRALVDLVDLLDPKRVRYPVLDVRGKLPLPIDETDRREYAGCERLARFTAHASDYNREEHCFPEDVLGEWALEHSLEPLPSSGIGHWAYRERSRHLGAHLVVHTIYRNGRMEIYGAAASPRWAHALRVAGSTLSLSSGE